MATLDNSNVVNGQTVEATDITQLYTALGTGSPGTITGLVMTGSLEGNAATATLATSASYSSVTETSYVFTTPDSQTQATKHGFPLEVLFYLPQVLLDSMLHLFLLNP